MVVELSMNENITRLFIEGLFRKYQRIPTGVCLQAKKCLLDYLGVTLGGASYVVCKYPDFLQSYRGEAGNASVLGTQLQLSALDACMLNGFFAHVLELDDGHRRGMIHLGAAVITAILATGETLRLSSEMVLKGIVMGYEAAVRCACAIQPGHKIRGYHVSGTCGTIGATMGVAFACGYNEKQMVASLDCAVTSAAGLLEIQEDASELKPYNLGRAAMDGVTAARMGKSGMPGPDDILGGKRGFLASMTDSPTSDYLVDFSNEDYAIEGIYQKVHAACRHCHPAIDAILELRDKFNLKPEQVGSIEVDTYKLAVGGHDHVQVQGVSSAKLSIPFSVALALAIGRVGYADYNEGNIRNEFIRELTQKVHVVEDEEFTEQSPAIRGARVVVRLISGETFVATRLFPKGEPESPLEKTELEDKFSSLAAYSGLTDKERNAVLSEISKVDFSINKIIDLLCKKS